MATAEVEGSFLWAEKIYHVTIHWKIVAIYGLFTGKEKKKNSPDNL